MFLLFDIPLLQDKTAFTYYVITEGGRDSLKCLRMIMGEGEGEGGWPYDDISKNNFFHKISFETKNK